jgi:PilZ domain
VPAIGANWFSARIAQSAGKWKMSTSLQELPAIPSIAERRFYPRIVPQNPVYFNVSEKTQALLLNISENGLLVSSHSELPRNFVSNVAIPLNGLPNPLQVTIRVVWSSETSMQAGIQLLNLSEHDREQIRRWGAQSFVSLAQPEHEQPAAVATAAQPEAKRSVVAAMAATVAAAALPNSISTAPVLPVNNQTSVTNRAVETPNQISALAVAPILVSAATPVLKKTASKSEWSKLKWPVVIAALFLSGLYLAESGAIANFIREHNENSEDAGLPPAPYTPTDQYIKPNSPASNSTPNNTFRAVAPANPVASPPVESTVKAQTLAERDLDKPPKVKEEVVPPLKPAPQVSLPQFRDVRNRPGPPRIPTPAPRLPQNNSPNQAPQNRNSSPSLNSVPPSQVVAKSDPAPDNSRAESSNEQISASSNQPANPNPPVPGKSSLNISPYFSQDSPSYNSESKNPSVDSAAKIQAVPAQPSYSHQPPATAAPRTSAPTNNIASFPSANPSAHSAVPSNRNAAASTPAMIPLKSRSPIIQMDVPERRVVSIRLPGDSNSFVNLPGERILETSSATVRIQRSVRAPKTTSDWLFHRDKEKRVTVGELTSRIDPQVPSTQLGPNDFVRVRATIDEDGDVVYVKPIHGAQNLTPVVVNAVHSWRFQTTLIDGKPVETESDVFIQFHPPKPRAAR